MSIIETAIREEARKLIARHQQYATELASRAQRYERRTAGSKKTRYVLTPNYWAANPGFNPYHVRKHTKSIAYAVKKALKKGTYAPRPPVEYAVPKPGGGLRRISVFQVADNAISRLVYKRLSSKNTSRLSARCYAYRTDRTIHDAVVELASAFSRTKRLFVAEFDFSKFFDRISHASLRSLLDDGRFHITPREKAIVWRFIESNPRPVDAYLADSGTREVGIPQGTSISLFLANLAGYHLDTKLEYLGVGSARYADDVVIWSDSYAKICDAVVALSEGAAGMGVDVNLRKSPGVSLLAPPGAPTEIRAKDSIEYLGYTIGTGGVSIKPSVVTRAKKHISRLIYQNLLEAPSKGTLDPARYATPIDRDYIVLLLQIRRYLYGELNEAQLRRQLTSDIPHVHFKGLLSFYPIVDDDRQLKSLDGWLLHTVHRSLKRKEQLIFGGGATSTLPPPHGLSKKELLIFIGTTSAGHKLDLRMPSFYRISRLLRRAARLLGAASVAHPKAGKYYIL